MAYRTLFTLLYCASLVACSENNDRSPATIDPLPEDNSGSLVSSPAAPVLPNTQDSVEEPIDPEPQDDFIDMNLSGVGVAVFGSVSIDKNLADNRHYYIAASLESELIRDSAVIELEGPSLSSQAIDASSISYSLAQRTYGVPIKASDIFRAKVTASIYALESVENNAPEEVVYITTSPFVHETPIQEFLNSYEIPQVELNVDVTSIGLPIETSVTTREENSEAFTSAFDFEILQISYYDNFLHLIVHFPSSCPADSYILYIEKQNADSKSLSLETKLLTERDEANHCGLELTRAFKFDLTPLRIHNERLFDDPFLATNLGKFGTYKPSSVPFAERKVFADREGCFQTNDCEIVLQFETDGRLLVKSPILSGAIAYIIGVDGLKIYSSVSLTGEPNILSADGTTLKVPSFDGINLVEQT